MRVTGVTFSIVLHVALVFGGIVIAPKLMAEPPAMTILPVDLLTIADTTNVKPVVEDKPKDAEKADETADKTAPTPAPAPEAKPAEPEPEALPDAKKPEPAKPKEEPKPAPEAKKPQKMSDALDSILKSVPDKKASKIQADRATANLRDVKDATARQGAGDNEKMTITIAAYISSQLRTRGCWPDQKDMPDARRLRATIRVRFERGGRMSEEPKLLDPARQPSGDQPMLVFIQRAFSSLKQCEPFKVPPEYFNNPGYIDLVFLP